jgi:hypothetical protein
MQNPDGVYLAAELRCLGMTNAFGAHKESFDRRDSCPFKHGETETARRLGRSGPTVGRENVHKPRLAT